MRAALDSAFSDEAFRSEFDGNGIEIAEFDKSTIFMDDGDGLRRRTAWAGAGDGVLFFDVGDDGAITEKRKYIFTERDPTAEDDLAAVRSVFDTNGGGKLTAADADFAKFKVMVTDADGSTTVQTLAALGITENNLTADRPARRFGHHRSAWAFRPFQTASPGCVTRPYFPP